MKKRFRLPRNIFQHFSSRSPEDRLKISSVPNPQTFKFSIFSNFFNFPRFYFSLIFISPILLFYLTILNQRKNDGFTTTKPTHKTWDQSQSLKFFIHSCSETSECLFSWMKLIQISDKNIICSLKKLIKF